MEGAGTRECKVREAGSSDPPARSMENNLFGSKVMAYGLIAVMSMQND